MFVPFKSIVEGGTVAVNPVQTTIIGPFETGPADTLSGSITNPDPSQTIQCSIQTSWDGISFCSIEWLGLADIQPGETRTFSVNTGKNRYMRIVGTASGAGVQVAVNAELSYLSAPPNGNRL